MMRSGPLRHKIVIKRPGTSTDVYGDRTGQDATVATVWASVSPLTGGERMRHMQMEGEVTHEIRFRWLPSVSIAPTDYAEFDSRVFQFVSIRNTSERDRETVVLAMEAV